MKPPAKPAAAPDRGRPRRTEAAAAAIVATIRIVAEATVAVQTADHLHRDHLAAGPRSPVPGPRSPTPGPRSPRATVASTPIVGTAVRVGAHPRRAIGRAFIGSAGWGGPHARRRLRARGAELGARSLSLRMPLRGLRSCWRWPRCDRVSSGAPFSALPFAASAPGVGRPARSLALLFALAATLAASVGPATRGAARSAAAGAAGAGAWCSPPALPRGPPSPGSRPAAAAHALPTPRHACRLAGHPRPARDRRHRACRGRPLRGSHRTCRLHRADAACLRRRPPPGRACRDGRPVALDPAAARSSAASARARGAGITAPARRSDFSLCMPRLSCGYRWGRARKDRLGREWRVCIICAARGLFVAAPQSDRECVID